MTRHTPSIELAGLEVQSDEVERAIINYALAEKAYDPAFRPTVIKTEYGGYKVYYKEKK